ncbi:hypothetical protein G1C98_0967 [Bifidobacterium sp. DSM 109960]|uniref:Uncharacterized protein n=1 Tax=Bifidobacterium erythrocebi TaxID=2675325 RepID=A0A7Y0ETP1_9BIFI|nr:hypothetical protein [Bifidobacterium sp. DSM 109960]NMM96231.1 hypothetical protein [Bifidobacterium sp. DSM 109960]
MIARLASLMLAAVMAVGMSVPSSTAYAVGGKTAQTTQVAQAGLGMQTKQAAEQGSAAQAPVCGQPWNQTDAGAAVDHGKPAGRLVGCISGSAVQYRLQNSTQWLNVQADANGHVSFDYTTKIAQFRFDAQFNIPKGTISATNRTFHYRIAGFKGTGSTMSGILNDGLGAYTISADGLVTITFSDQAIASNANAPLDNGRLYIEADRSKVTGGNPGQTILDFGNGHVTTIDMYRKSGTPAKQAVGTPTQKPDGTLRATWRISYANTGTIDQPIVKIEDWMAYENVSGDGSSAPGRGWYSADDIASLYQTLTATMGAGTLDVYPVTVSGTDYKTSNKAARWQPGTMQNGTYWKWVFQPNSYVVKPGQTLELQYDSTFANSALHPASKNTSRFYLSDKKGDYYTKSAVVWNSLRPRITLAKTAGSQRIPSADECRTLGVGNGSCALASWNVTVGNSGKGDLPVGWIVQDTGNGVWYTKNLLRTSLKVAVNGMAVTGTIQVSSNGGKNWTDLDQAGETTRYTSFRFIAGSVLAPGANASVTYESLFDPAGTSVRRNSATAGTGVGGSFANTVTANVQAASLVKDGCSDPITTAGAPKFTSCGANGADYTINAGGDPETSLRVGWRISAHVTDNWRKSPLVFDETLPEGLRDVRFAFSDYANNKKWLGVGETTFTNIKGVQYRVTLEKTGDRTYRITIPQQASDLMNAGNVYLYVAAKGPDVNDGAYWTEGRYDSKRGCVADSALRAGTGDCLAIGYHNTVSMRSGTIPPVSTSETVTTNFRKTNSGVGDKQNVDSDWAADGKSFTRTYYVRANRYGLNIDPSHKTHNGTADPDTLPIRDVLTGAGRAGRQQPAGDVPGARHRVPGLDRQRPGLPRRQNLPAVPGRDRLPGERRQTRRHAHRLRAGLHTGDHQLPVRLQGKRRIRPEEHRAIHRYAMDGRRQGQRQQRRHQQQRRQRDDIDDPAAQNRRQRLRLPGPRRRHIRTARMERPRLRLGHAQADHRGDGQERHDRRRQNAGAAMRHGLPGQGGQSADRLRDQHQDDRLLPDELRCRNLLRTGRRARAAGPIRAPVGRRLHHDGTRQEDHRIGHLEQGGPQPARGIPDGHHMAARTEKQRRRMGEGQRLPQQLRRLHGKRGIRLRGRRRQGPSRRQADGRQPRLGHLPVDRNHRARRIPAARQRQHVGRIHHQPSTSQGADRA